MARTAIVVAWAAALLACAGCGDRAIIVADLPGGGSPVPQPSPFDCPGLRTTPGGARPDVPFPGYLQSYVDPVYGVKVTRITGDPGTPIPAAGRSWDRRTRGIAPTKQVWNADETLLHLNFGGSLLLDGETYGVVGRLSTPAVGTWHPVDPAALIYVEGNGVFRLDVRSGATDRLVSVPGYSAFSQVEHRDYLSRDGRYTSVAARRDSDGAAVGFLIDLVSGRKGPDVAFADHGLLDASDRSAIVTPSGRHLVLQGVVTAGGRRAPEGFLLFDGEGNLVRQRAIADLCPGVGDMALDLVGGAGEVGRCEEVGPLAGRTVLWRHDDGGLVDVGPGDTFGSGRAFRRPGWFVVYSLRDALLYAVRLDGARVEYLLDARWTSPLDPWARPDPVPSPSGTRVLFSTNWGTGPGLDDDDAQSFVADFRAQCASRR